MKQKILITGSTGFIGTELVKRLARDGHEIHTLERYVTGRYNNAQEGVIKHYANLSDYNKIREIVRDIQPNAVMHTGAISAVSYSYDNYIEVTDVDYTSSLNLAEACRQEAHNFKQFIFSGTSECYGMTLQDKSKKLTENSQLMPNSPYAVAKVAFDYYLHYMGMAYKFPYTILRPFNTYGRQNNKHFFIERTISQMLEGNEVRLGDPNTIRDWLYVSDHVEGFMKSLNNKKAIDQTINLGTGVGYTTKQTAEIIAKIVGYKGKIVWNTIPSRPLDATILIADNTKAQKLLAWKPKFNLEEGLKDFIRK